MGKSLWPLAPNEDGELKMLDISMDYSIGNSQGTALLEELSDSHNAAEMGYDHSKGMEAMSIYEFMSRCIATLRRNNVLLIKAEKNPQLYGEKLIDWEKFVRDEVQKMLSRASWFLIEGATHVQLD